MKTYINVHALSRPLFGVEVSLRLSTPLTLKESPRVSKEAPVRKVYMQGAPNGTAGIRGIPRFLRRRCRDGGIDRLIDRSNRRTNLSEIPQLRGSVVRVREKAPSAQPEMQTAACSSALRFMRSLASLTSLTLVAPKFLTRFFISRWELCASTYSLLLWKSILL